MSALVLFTVTFCFQFRSSAGGSRGAIRLQPENFLFFTLRAVDEVLRFTYSGGNFLHSGNFQ
ncbi:hypothetical protein DMH17_08675 [Raoultella planticola]|nr:hypothetical protein [Raoultella planticola]